MKRLNAFSITELMVIISIVTGLIIVTAPSFYGIFKSQFLIYNSHQLVQNIRSIQTNAFIEHNFYKIGFNSETNTYTLWKATPMNWQEESASLFDDNITLEYNQTISNTTHIMYGPNGFAYTCNESNTPNECTKLTNQAQLTLKTEKKDIIIQFLPINGFVSTNISVK